MTWESKPLGQAASAVHRFVQPVLHDGWAVIEHLAAAYMIYRIEGGNLLSQISVGVLRKLQSST